MNHKLTEKMRWCLEDAQRGLIYFYGGGFRRAHDTYGHHRVTINRLVALVLMEWVHEGVRVRLRHKK